VAAAAVLWACAPEKPVFHGTDLTGVEWGRELRLRDPEGRLRTIADFRGRVVLLFFGFVQCPDVCPSALARALEVRRLLGAEGERVQVVFVTVDPARDTPELLREYVRAFDPGFVALRGDEEETRAAAREFKVFYEKVPTGSSYTINHSALTYAFDTAGRLRLAHRHTQTAAEVAADVRVLLASSEKKGTER